MRFYSKIQELAYLDEVTGDLITFVRDYFKEWRKPCCLRMLHRRFGSRFRLAGCRIHDRLAQLNAERALIVRISESGSTLVSPGLSDWTRAVRSHKPVSPIIS